MDHPVYPARWLISFVENQAAVIAANLKTAVLCE
jgi:hypothetical protein